MIIYVTGGVRSGKSRFAMDLALQKCANPVYVATSRIWDEDFARRVKRHQDERGQTPRTTRIVGRKASEYRKYSCGFLPSFESLATSATNLLGPGGLYAMG